jgi:RNA polymerase sigma-54 factor
MASSTSVKSLLKDIIAKENPKSPLSDIQIADSLSKNGFKIARRTITKYRESLSIPPSNERKNLAK